MKKGKEFKRILSLYQINSNGRRNILATARYFIMQKKQITMMKNLLHNKSHN